MPCEETSESEAQSQQARHHQTSLQEEEKLAKRTANFFRKRIFFLLTFSRTPDSSPLQFPQNLASSLGSHATLAESSNCTQMEEELVASREGCFGSRPPFVHPKPRLASNTQLP